MSLQSDQLSLTIWGAYLSIYISTYIAPLQGNYSEALPAQHSPVHKQNFIQTVIILTKASPKLQQSANVWGPLICVFLWNFKVIQYVLTVGSFVCNNLGVHSPVHKQNFIQTVIILTKASPKLQQGANVWGPLFCVFLWNFKSKSEKFCFLFLVLFTRISNQYLDRILTLFTTGNLLYRNRILLNCLNPCKFNF